METNEVHKVKDGKRKSTCGKRGGVRAIKGTH